jgi:uncharacterized protein YjbI with pentapeptide repeats
VGANLRGANLKEARLRSVDLRGADLETARLTDADLSYANLEEARLSKALNYLDRADLRRATMPNGQKYEEWLKDKEGRREEGENSGPT